ncbi:tRNA guanosine-2'-O-methyltransferase trm13, putative, partial [Ixodes scapularis]
KTTCSAALLSKHLKKCNAKAKEAHEYFVRNINSGLPKPEGSQNSTKLFLKDVSDEELLATIEKLERISEALADRPETYVGLHEGLSAELDELSDCAVAQKHLRQKAALLGLAESRGLLGEQACYVEFGAGRGRLSYWLAKILSGKGCRFLLVDRASSRHKFENKIRREEQENSSEIRRLQIDIEHLCLGNVDLVKVHEGRLVGLCKHLCGEATDFAIRCLVETTGKTSDSGAATSALQGLLMAVCCHHRCRWASFVGRPFLEQVGVSERDFELLTCLAGWATCAARGTFQCTSRRRQSF